MWAYANCEGIFRDRFKAIKSLSSLSNFVYYCQANDSARTSQLSGFNQVFHHKLVQKLQILLNNNSLLNILLSKKLWPTCQPKLISFWQAQEQKLSTQITSTSNAIGKFPSKSVATSNDRKSNVVAFGVDSNVLKSALKILWGVLAF